MNRTVVASVAAFALASCDSPTSCPLSFLNGVVSHVGSTLPLDTKADCAGASRLNNEAYPLPKGVVCYSQPSDSPCVVCVGAECCAQIDARCASASAETCAADPAVKACVLTALADKCAAACGTGNAGADPDADAGTVDGGGS